MPLPGGGRGLGATGRPAAPAIPVPGVRERALGTPFAEAAALPSGVAFQLPNQRISDTAVTANGTKLATAVERVRYVATEVDLEWLAATRQEVTKAQAAALIVTAFEGVVTALELTSLGNPSTPYGRIVPAGPLLAASLADCGASTVTAITPESAACKKISEYWAAKRAATEGRPLIPDLLVWPLGERAVPDTPFLSREQPLDVWLRVHPAKPAAADAEDVEAAKRLRALTTTSRALAHSVVVREATRLEHTYAIIQELAAVRRQVFAGLPLPSGETAPGGVFMTDEQLDSPADETLASTALATAAAAATIKSEGGSVKAEPGDEGSTGPSGLKAHRREGLAAVAGGVKRET